MKMSYPKFYIRLKALLFDSVILSVSLIGIILMSSNIDFANNVYKVFFILLPVLSIEPLFTAFTGGSLGHHYAGLKIINAEKGGNLSLIRSYIRIFIKLPLSLYSFISILLTKRHQAIHDLVSGSVVVFKKEHGVPENHKLKERKTLYTNDKPTKIRRFVVASAYFIIFLFVDSLLINVYISGKCLEFGVCSDEDLFYGLLNTGILLVAFLFFYILGFLCKLPGAIYKQQDS